jgi:hypothetical protein
MTRALSPRHCSPLIALLALVLCIPATLLAQSGTIGATATVLPRPLSIRDVVRTATPDEVLVLVDGCARGALTVDARTNTSTVRTARHLLAPGDRCGIRSVTIQLSSAEPGTVEYVISLQQSDALQSPSFAQIVVSARDLSRRALGY